MKSVENVKKSRKTNKKQKFDRKKFCAILRLKFGVKILQTYSYFRVICVSMYIKRFKLKILVENGENSIRIHPSREKPINHRPISFVSMFLPLFHTHCRTSPNWRFRKERKNLF